MARHSYFRSATLRRRPVRERQKRGRSRALVLALVLSGGFSGTLAALQARSIDEAIAAAGSAIEAARLPRGGQDALSARFGFCHSGGGRDCVVDGDTFWFAGEKYRIADIDTPETHPARCASEAALGAAATEHLQDWLNAGAFSLESIDRDTDRYGRKLRIVTRGGTSVGDVLVDAGLARRWEGHRSPWC